MPTSAHSHLVRSAFVALAVLLVTALLAFGALDAVTDPAADRALLRASPSTLFIPRLVAPLR